MTQQKTPVAELSYSQALEELQQLIRELQNNNCDVDQLTDKTRRASELLNECRKRLTTAEEEVRKVLENIKAD